MNGKWITCDKNVATPMFVRNFYADNNNESVIDISGLGFFTLLIKGKKVTSDFFPLH